MAIGIGALIIIFMLLIKKLNHVQINLIKIQPSH